MNVRVRCFTGMRPYAPDGQGDFSLELVEGATLRELLRQLQVPADATPFIAVNGRRAEAHHTLHDGDEVVMFTTMEGG